MILYKTIEKPAESEQVIERSRFIAHAKPVETREAADDFIAEIKKKYKDATHNVPAMVLGDKFQVQWASDDGEPQGTSGAPMVQMLVKEGITNVVIVVTRYFGGIKLGTGGLVRAYTGSAGAVIKNAGVREVKEVLLISVKIDYSILAKIQSMAEDDFFSVENILYEDVVTIDLQCDIENADKLKTLISNVSGGKEKIVSEVKKNA
ncbi:MAG: YigZ family protein [Eubacteriaceae bacterium]|nr:YigZ family protein [Eubacteriaceae bacterium]